MMADVDRDIGDGLDGAEMEPSMVLTDDELFEWTRRLLREGSGVERPPAYFPENAEWSDSIKDMKAAIDRLHPEMEPLSPPEAAVFKWGNEEMILELLDLLCAAPDSAAREWRASVMSIITPASEEVN